MITASGITPRVDIVWGRDDGVELLRIEGVSPIALSDNLVEYAASYNITLLSTMDDNRTYHCAIIITDDPPVVVDNTITLDVTGMCQNIHVYEILFCFTVPVPVVTISPSGPVQGTLIGSAQDIQCTVNVVDGVEPNVVMISWMGPGGDTITNDSRIMISPTSGSGYEYTSTLQFVYLMEGDEGRYTCNVEILETNALNLIELSNITGKILAFIV